MTSAARPGLSNPLWRRSVFTALAVISIAAMLTVALASIQRRPFAVHLQLRVRQVEFQSADPWQLADHKIMRLSIHGIDSLRLSAGAPLSRLRARGAVDRDTRVSRIRPLTALSEIGIVGPARLASVELPSSSVVLGVANLDSGVVLVTLQATEIGRAHV